MMVAVNPIVAVLTWPSAFGLTVLVEVPVWTALLVAVVRVSIGRGVVVAIVVNAVSHPLFWFLVHPVAVAAMGDTWAALAAAEVVVVIVEAVVARALVRTAGMAGAATRPASSSTLLAISFVANACSLGVGLLIAAT